MSKQLVFQIMDLPPPHSSTPTQQNVNIKLGESGGMRKGINGSPYSSLFSVPSSRFFLIASSMLTLCTNVLSSRGQHAEPAKSLWRRQVIQETKYPKIPVRRCPTYKSPPPPPVHRNNILVISPPPPPPRL